MQRRNFLKLSGATLAVPSLGVFPSFAQSAVRGGVLRFATGGQPATLDPHMNATSATALIARGVFEQLLAMNANYQPQPMLAESVEQSADGMVFTFHLRKGVPFHNGKIMTSEDVVASLTKWLTTSSKKSLFESYKLEAPDPHVVVLTMGKKVLGVLEAIADYGQFSGIMPKEIAEAAPSSGATEYVGTGPYKFGEWRQDQFISLTRFDEYSSLEMPASGLSGGKVANFDEVIYYFVGDSSTRLAGIMTDQYDVAADLPFDNFKQIEADPNMHILTSLGNLTGVFNKKEGLFADRKMRQAINSALDPEAILIGTPAFPEVYRLDSSYMYQEQSNWHSTAGSGAYNHQSVERTRDLLKEAGYNGETVRLLTTRDFEYQYNTAVIVQEQLKSVGIAAEVMVRDWPTLLGMRAKPAEWDMFFTNFPLVPVPTQILYLNSNWAGWTDDPTITEYMARLNASTSLDEAKELWQELQGYCWDYLPVAKIGDRYTYSSHSARLTDVGDFHGLVVWNTGFAS